MISKDIFKSELFTKPEENKPMCTAEAFLSLCGLARWREVPLCVKNAKVYQYELIASLRFLAVRFGWNKGSVERTMNWWVNSGYISRRYGNGNTIIKIKKFLVFGDQKNSSGTVNGTANGTAKKVSYRTVDVSGNYPLKKDKSVSQTSCSRTLESSDSGTVNGTENGTEVGQQWDSGGTNKNTVYTEYTEYTEKNKKKIIIKKVQYSEFVFLHETEHNKLVDKYGEAFTQACINALDSYIPNKPSHPYKDHYRAILTWVVRQVKEEKSALNTDKTLGRKDRLGIGILEDIRREEEEKAKLAKEAESEQIRVCN